MNISQAKDYIKNSIKIYLKKDEYGDYRIPVVRQRPIFLLGAPGIGKTAIMEQIAGELGIALVAYSMTHHTRQSALGLPFIRHKSYNGMEYDVSEYTMSEIIATIYETMETSGIKEGILFLDEINCVSETLAPSMLQFLQYKVFGRHRVPDGWVIVTAGNPPEYNKSVREFDVVTMDRLKVLAVEADYDTWRQYAEEKGIHNAILTFLEMKKDYFYHMETTAAGRSYVTARGWEDLSEIISMYEEDGIAVDETLVGQYLQNDRIVREFTAYYDLYNKYKKDYRVSDILEGDISDEVCAKAGKAPFDERLSLAGMLLDRVIAEMREVIETSDYLSYLVNILKKLKAKAETGDDSKGFAEAVRFSAEAEERKLYNLERANSLSIQDRKKYKRVIAFLGNAAHTGNFDDIKKEYDELLSGMRRSVENTGRHAGNMFDFVNRAFSEGNELLIIITRLTVNSYSARYISTFGCEEYTKYNELLMVSERQGNIRKEIENLGINRDS